MRRILLLLTVASLASVCSRFPGLTVTARSPAPTPAADRTLLPTGKAITLPPLGTQFGVGGLPVNMILSPDGKYTVTTGASFRQFLWSLRTSDGVGINSVEFGFDPTDPLNSLYYGLAFASDGTLYAAQGWHDTVALLKLGPDGMLTQNGAFSTQKGDWPAGLALDGRGYLYVSNHSSLLPFTPASVAIYDTKRTPPAEQGRYTFRTDAVGTVNFPLAIAAVANGGKVYVASQRDGLVYVLNTTDPAHPALRTTIPSGAHPDALLLNKAQSLLFIANASSDTVSVVNTATDQVLRTLLLRPAAARDLPGATPTGLALSPDEQTLYVTLGDMNAVAVIDAAKYRLKSYIPVGWYPTAVVVSPDNKRLLVANGNGTQTRYPNPLFDPFHPDANALEVASPHFVYNVIEGNVSTIPRPTSASALANYSREVLANNRLLSRPGFATRNPLVGIGVRTGKIQHVIYIVKENRSYDQILGDLPQGNGDPSLAIFGREATPNQHALAERFVLLDNFYNNGAVSGEGWTWLTQGYANEFVERNIPYLYRIPTPPGPSPTNDIFDLNYDYEGQNNGYPTGGFPAKDVDGKQLSRLFPDGLPPIPNITEGPGGYIWDLVKRARLTYRNYGFFLSMDNGTGVIPDNYPNAVNLQPEGHDLAGVTDYDFRRFDLDYADSDAGHLYFQQTGDPDYVPFVPAYGKYNMPSRFSEWNREFQQMLARDPTGRAVPQFMMIRFPRNHSQGLAPSVFSPPEKRHIIHAPRAMVADNDYAVGQFVETISKSPIWKSTAIFIIEDDAQFGPDHVDAHRSPCFVVSPWIKKSSVDHTFYTTGSVLKTIELLLGLPSMTQYDAVAKPIMGWDNRPSNDALYTAILPPKEIMRETNPALASLARNDRRRRLAVLSQKMNFRTPDSAPALLLNEILWKSVRGPNAKPPAPRFSTIAALKARGRKVSQPRDVDD